MNNNGVEAVDDEYIEKMERLAMDCEAGNVGGISCHQVGEFYNMVKVSMRRLFVNNMYTPDLCALNCRKIPKQLLKCLLVRVMGIATLHHVSFWDAFIVSSL